MLSYSGHTDSSWNSLSKVNHAITVFTMNAKEDIEVHHYSITKIQYHKDDYMVIGRMA